MCKSFNWNSQYQLDVLSSRVISSERLLAIRIVLLLWHSTMCLYIGITRWHTSDNLPLGVTLSYISYSLVVLYLIGLVVCTFANMTLYKQSSSYPYHLVHHRTMSMIPKILWVSFEILAPVRLLVCIVFWSVLYHGQTLWSTIHMHIPFTILLEIILNRFNIVPLHLIFLIIAGVSYIGLALIVHHYTGKFVYPFLDYTKEYAALAYTGVVVGSVALYVLVYYMVKLRNSCTPIPAGETRLLKERGGSSSVDMDREYSRAYDCDSVNSVDSIVSNESLEMTPTCFRC